MRRRFFRMILIFFPAICLIWGFFIEPDRLKPNDYILRSRKWSHKVDGFKIVAVSDLHAGANFIDDEKVRRIVNKINEQNPDLVVLLGDYISYGYFDKRSARMPVSQIAENLRGIQSKYGTFAILGNSDEAYIQEIRTDFEKIGVKVLYDETATVDVNGENIRLLGMRDKMISGDWSDISKNLKRILQLESSNDKILALVHNPDYLPLITGDLSISDNLSLILAGHTHGGQVRFPLIGTPIVPSEYGQKYAGGLVRDQETDMFVTTGIGTSIIPVRFGVPPEIAVLTIYAE